MATQSAYLQSLMEVGRGWSVADPGARAESIHEAHETPVTPQGDLETPGHPQDLLQDASELLGLSDYQPTSPADILSDFSAALPTGFDHLMDYVQDREGPEDQGSEIQEIGEVDWTSSAHRSTRTERISGSQKNPLNQTVSGSQDTINNLVSAEVRNSSLASRRTRFPWAD